MPCGTIPPPFQKKDMSEYTTHGLMDFYLEAARMLGMSKEEYREAKKAIRKQKEKTENKKVTIK